MMKKENYSVWVTHEGVMEIREFSKMRKGKSLVWVAYEIARKERGYLVWVVHEGVIKIEKFSRMRKERNCSF